jgi:hypothetical protein
MLNYSEKTTFVFAGEYSEKIQEAAHIILLI